MLFKSIGNRFKQCLRGAASRTSGMGLINPQALIPYYRDRLGDH